jgi:hypothetical protein
MQRWNTTLRPREREAVPGQHKLDKRRRRIQKDLEGPLIAKVLVFCLVIKVSVPSAKAGELVGYKMRQVLGFSDPGGLKSSDVHPTWRIASTILRRAAIIAGTRALPPPINIAAVIVSTATGPGTRSASPSGPRAAEPTDSTRNAA